MAACLAAGRLGGELLCIISRFSYTYTYIYGAYPGAYLVTCVSENIYGAYPGAYPLFKRIRLRVAALCELNPLVSRGRRYKFETPCRANAVAGKGFVLRWPAHTLRIPKKSNSDVQPALSRHPGCAYGKWKLNRIILNL